MSASITIAGRLGADPELKFAGNGTAVVKLRVVSAGRRKDGDQWVDVDTTWWQVTAFKTLAEACADHLVKGDAIVLSGTVKGREWEDQKTGEKRSAMEVIADHIGLDLARPRKNSANALGSSQVETDDPWATSSEAPF